MSFASAELNGILPVQGGFYRWTRAAFGDFWGFQCGWWNWTGTFLLNSLYGVLVMDYLVHYFPGLTGNAKWAGACLVLCFLSYLNIRGIQVSGWLSVAMLVAILIPVVWLCAASLAALALQPTAPLDASGQTIRCGLRRGARSRDVELCRLRAIVERYGRNARSAKNVSAHPALEHADEHPHLHPSRFACHRSTRQLAGLANRLHS